MSIAWHVVGILWSLGFLIVGTCVVSACWDDRQRHRADVRHAQARQVPSQTPIYDATAADLDVCLWELELEPGAS